MLFRSLEKLKGLSPLEKLNQGYAYVSDDQEKKVTGIHQLQIDDMLKIHLTDGYMRARITEKVAVHFGIERPENGGGRRE